MRAVMTEFADGFLGVEVVTGRNHHFQAGKTVTMTF
jgi:hypothetical protein